MRAFRALVVAAAWALTAPVSAQIPRIIEGADQAIWSGEVAKGPVTHRLTGVSFPDELAGLKRTRLAAFGGETDVVVNYVGGQKTLTIFLFKPRGYPEHQLKGAINAVGLRSPEAFVWSDGPFDVDGAQKLRLFKGTYKIGIGPNTIMDYLYFGALGTWTVKVRMTLPSPKEVAEEQAVDAAVRALPWPAILQANGTCTGRACDATRTMPFDHHIMEMMLSQIIKTDASKINGAAAGPLFSKRDGDREWNVYPLDAKVSELFTKSFGAISVTPPLYSLSVRTKGADATIVRFFSGAPDATLFEQTVRTLTKTPEPGPMVSPTTAAEYAPD